MSRDPYVQLKYGGQQFTSAVHNKGGLEPVWKDVFEIRLDPANKQFTFKVQDKDPLSSDMCGEHRPTFTYSLRRRLLQLHAMSRARVQQGSRRAYLS